MKKMIALALAGAMLIGLAACTVTAAPQPAETTGRPEQSITVTEPAGTSAGEHFSGVVFMTENGKTVYEAAGGVEKTKTKEPITLDTKFCIGSVSKQFAAAAILILQQDGKLSVDDSLAKYFPQYEPGKQLTLRNLLDMRSGIPEFYDVEYIDGAFTELPTGDLRGVITNDNTAAENRQLLEDWLMEQPLQFAPDTDFEYCNSNYFLLARIVELVSGKSYNDFVRERIFQPLGMTNSSFIDDADFSAVEHLAAPTVHPQTVHVGVTMGLGDMISNARDMDLWLTSLRTNKVLTKESVDMMSTDYTEGVDEDYGFGIRMNGEGLYHTGNITTYQAMVYTDISKGINLFAVTNDDLHADESVDEICWDLIASIHYK